MVSNAWAASASSVVNSRTNNGPASRAASVITAVNTSPSPKMYFCACRTRSVRYAP